MSTSIALATIADLEAHPGRCELIDGEIVEMAPASPWHGRVTSRVVIALAAYAAKMRGEILTGEVGFIWDTKGPIVRAPDVAYLDAKRAKAIPERGYMPIPPVLAVEVVSPNDAWTDVRAKVRGWLEHGALVVWVVDPKERTIAVYLPGKPPIELADGDEIDGGQVLPGFRAKVTALFP